MGQIKFVTGLIMAVLFTVAIVVFTINFGIDNDSSIKLGDDDDYSSIQSNLVGDLQDFNDAANSSGDTLMSTTQDEGDQSASSGGQFKVGVTTAMSMVTTILTLGFAKIFGEDTGFGIFLTAITSILLWMIGLYVWKTWKGNPD